MSARCLQRAVALPARCKTCAWVRCAAFCLPAPRPPLPPADYLLHSLHKAEEFMVLHPAAEARMVRTPLPKVELFRKGHALRDTR